MRHPPSAQSMTQHDPVNERILRELPRDGRIPDLDPAGQRGLPAPSWPAADCSPPKTFH